MRWCALILAVAVAGCAESVQIRSAPPGATVYIDNTAIGTTPVEFKTHDVKPVMSRLA